MTMIERLLFMVKPTLTRTAPSLEMMSLAKISLLAMGAITLSVRTVTLSVGAITLSIGAIMFSVGTILRTAKGPVRFRKTFLAGRP